MIIETLLVEYAAALAALDGAQPMPDGEDIKRVEDARAAILRVFSDTTRTLHELADMLEPHWKGAGAELGGRWMVERLGELYDELGNGEANEAAR